MYCISITTAATYLAISNLYYVIMFDMFDTRAIGVTSFCFTTAFDSIYFLLRRKRFHLLMRDFHLITKTLTDDGGLLTTGSESVILRRAARANLIFKYFVLFYVSVPFILNVFNYVNHLVTGSSELANPVPFDINSFPFLYEIVSCLYVVVSVTGCGRQVASSGFFFVMMFHLNLCLKQLRITSTYVFQNDQRSGEQQIENFYNNNKIGFFIQRRNDHSLPEDKSNSNKEFLTAWIKVYQQILR